LWSAPANTEHPVVVESIHREYVAAGCELITANTFRTTWYLMERSSLQAWWETWNRHAVALARRAAASRAWVLASVTTLEDCYRPDRVPAPHRLRLYHGRQVDLLASLEVDGLLLETFNSLRELKIAYDLARRYSWPVLASVVLRDGQHLYDGSPLSEVVAWAKAARPDVLLVNCSSPTITDLALRVLVHSDLDPFGAYANVGRPGGEMGFEFTHAVSPAGYADWVKCWARRGARVIGGCCGTTPAYLRAAALAVNRMNL
jgi:S-methylmethionine-dependent homocysteine/selenocysteine methylase